MVVIDILAEILGAPERLLGWVFAPLEAVVLSLIPEITIPVPDFHVDNPFEQLTVHFGELDGHYNDILAALQAPMVKLDEKIDKIKDMMPKGMPFTCILLSDDEFADAALGIEPGDELESEPESNDDVKVAGRGLASTCRPPLSPAPKLPVFGAFVGLSDLVKNAVFNKLISKSAPEDDSKGTRRTRRKAKQKNKVLGAPRVQFSLAKPITVLPHDYREVDPADLPFRVSLNVRVSPPPQAKATKYLDMTMEVRGDQENGAGQGPKCYMGVSHKNGAPKPLFGRRVKTRQSFASMIRDGVQSSNVFPLEFKPAGNPWQVNGDWEAWFTATLVSRLPSSGLQCSGCYECPAGALCVGGSTEPKAEGGPGPGSRRTWGTEEDWRCNGMETCGDDDIEEDEERFTDEIRLGCGRRRLGHIEDYANHTSRTSLMEIPAVTRRRSLAAQPGTRVRATTTRLYNVHQVALGVVQGRSVDPSGTGRPNIGDEFTRLDTHGACLVKIVGTTKGWKDQRKFRELCRPRGGTRMLRKYANLATQAANGIEPCIPFPPATGARIGCGGGPGKWNWNWISSAGCSQYQVEHIVDNQNANVPLLWGSPPSKVLNTLANWVMTYGLYNNKVGQLHWTDVVREKRVVYGKRRVPRLDAIIKLLEACHDWQKLGGLVSKVTQQHVDVMQEFQTLYCS